MVGRNGHQRWSEALDIVQEFWRKLPPSYRFNLHTGRYEERYENRDCSGYGFEGIRAQDILPLLIEYFHFELFLGFGNIIDPFVDRGIGSNFNPSAAWDRSFIDQVNKRDEEEILSGRISPTHMIAVVGNDPAIPLSFREPLTPQFCMRDPARVVVGSAMPDAYDWDAWPHTDRPQLEFVCRKLKECEDRVKAEEAEVAVRTAWALRCDRDIVDLGQNVENLREELRERTVWAMQLDQELQERNQELQERTAWAMQLDQELNERTAWAMQLDQELNERTTWAMQLDQELNERTAMAIQLRQENEKLATRAAEIARDLDQLAWARVLDRRFHGFLDGAFRMVRWALRRNRLRT